MRSTSIVWDKARGQLSQWKVPLSFHSDKIVPVGSFLRDGQRAIKGFFDLLETWKTKAQKLCARYDTRHKHRRRFISQTSLFKIAADKVCGYRTTLRHRPFPARASYHGSIGIPSEVAVLPYRLRRLRADPLSLLWRAPPCLMSLLVPGVV